MGRLQVAILQMRSCGSDLSAATAKAEDYCRRAKAAGAHIALMPEFWGRAPLQEGDDKDETLKAWGGRPLDREGEYVNHFRALARELDMAIAASYMEQWPGYPRNSVSLIDRHGKIRFTYAKVHTWELGASEVYCTPGEDFYVEDLDVGDDTVRVGAMICYDREFPESARILMLKGAELILVPNACVLNHQKRDQIKTRAFENAVLVAVANYTGLQRGRSAAYDAEGELVVEAGAAEGIYMASFDLERTREVRAKETYHANTFRRPHRYGLLIDRHKDPIFERDTAIGNPFIAEER